MAGVLGVSLEGIGAVTARLARTPGRLDEAEKGAVKEGSIEALRRFRIKVSGDVLKRRTGNYAKSTTAAPPSKDVAGWKAEVGVKKGPAGKYAELHETGGTIKPKRGKVLAIPIGPNLTAAGVARFNSPRDPRMFGGFWKRLGGALLFLVPKGRDDKSGSGVFAYFIGVPQVVIPKREPLGKTLREMEPRMRAIVSEHVTRALSRA